VPCITVIVYKPAMVVCINRNATQLSNMYTMPSKLAKVLNVHFSSDSVIMKS